MSALPSETKTTGMVVPKTITITLLLSVLIFMGVAAMKAPQQHKRNLKILPKDISDQKLDSIMDSYSVALGVKCNFCHKPYPNTTDSLNFASDEEPMKENARKMMRLVIDINKKYFWFDKKIKPEFLNAVVCNTCHRGQEFPPAN